MANEPNQAVARMVYQLRHRGPDGCGLRVLSRSKDLPNESGPSVILGHTRLAILDLSVAGCQPMSDSVGTLHITFNGEIYNFKQLRQELGTDGWRSQSDTEVILRAYSRWGPACVRHLRGMFAFAIWDASREELFLTRDRVGIKPLYYYGDPTQGFFVFASEVRALLATGLVPRELDPVGVSEYLAYQSLPAPRTLVKGVRALPPGSWMVVGGTGNVHQEHYWDLLANALPAASGTQPDARQQLHELLRESIGLHLVSDVPVAAFLSGGIDSSAIVALMREVGDVPKTFSVTFSEREYDEAPYARIVATRFGTNHTEIALSEADLLADLPGALAAMDQPTGDGVNTYIVSRAVSATGIKVALSGLGGDELFAGYPTFRRLQRFATLLHMWGRTPKQLRSLAAHAVQFVGGSSVRSYKCAALLASDGRLPSLYPPLRQVFLPRQRRALLAPDWVQRGEVSQDPYAALLDAAFDAEPPKRVLSCISYAEARTYMHDVLLRDTDQMSMSHGLEVRVPLLDHVLMEYVIGLPDNEKQPNGTPKRLLVESLDGLLPQDTVRRPKRGFVLPFDLWMRQQLRSFCDERLARARLIERGIFQPDGVRALWRDFLERRPGVSWSRVWVLVVLQEWLERNGF